jgi:hypothetical protein
MPTSPKGGRCPFHLGRVLPHVSGSCRPRLCGNVHRIAVRRATVTPPDVFNCLFDRCGDNEPLTGFNAL